MNVLEHCACGQLPAARQAARDLDGLVAEFCKALGEPVPVDAIRRAQQLAGAVATLTSVRVWAEIVRDRHSDEHVRRHMRMLLGLLDGKDPDVFGEQS